jgi:asparagine synthase (glutamine-hydrolysing)
LSSRLESLLGVERRRPFMDRRLVEFALALPEEQRWRLDKAKFILRQAMKGILPESIRLRSTKADFSYAFVEAFESFDNERLFDDLAIESLGWINGAEARRMYRQLIEAYETSDSKYISYVWKLWMVLGIELWFNAAFVNEEASKSVSLERIGIQAI